MSNKNMFALLNDSDSDDVAQAPKKAPAAKAPAPAPAKNKSERKPRNDRPPKEDRAPRGDREDRSQYDGSRPSNPAEERQGKGERRDRSGKGKGGKGRGDSGRDYPRRSGTGRGRENPRSGGGKYNWGKDTEQQPAQAAPEGETPAEGAPAPEPEPIIEEEPEEPTMSLEEYEKLQADKLAELNGNIQEEREVEAVDEDLLLNKGGGIEDQYACMFHDMSKKGKKKHGKAARDGAVQADKVLSMKYVDENDSGKGGKGGKGDRRQGKGERRQGKGNQGGANKSNIDLSNASAFPTLGA